MLSLRPFSFVAFLGLAVCLALAAPARAQLFETKAKEAYMIDADTGTILYAKNADEPIPPASLAKLMTMEVLFNALKSGRYKLDDTFAVSENAWRNGGAGSGGSTMFAALKSNIRIEDLVQAIAVQSANDGCIIVAEGMAGTEENFAQLMTDRARELGLTKSVFKNSTGLPADGEVVTARELVELGMHLWREYPEYYKYFAEKDFTWNKITQRNRNPLLTMDIGADGLKTGYTKDSGYAIVGSISHDGRRIFAALSGMSSDRERSEESRKLLDWGMRSFQRTELFGDGEVVTNVTVYGGARSTVPLKAKGPISVLVPMTNRDRLSARVVYDGPIMAPIEEGTQIGTLRISVGDTLSQETPLYAAETIGLGTLQQRAIDAAGELLVGWLR
ncbi:D-alanyl-D-alanine carboxypeptidase (penicillin-binding protein 5/6) [Mesorhizobium soli]|uniref:D-alanyl-D-alanine carboxypeptidase family protein n=1 Tax=Pseudaminobacter soli (ex Li et al. 2025) TaxID=1295366 RepID=UPI00247393DC|nr:D-alanyl-D-alanine carboxypeptidase family protein [Mesorhizobium soli]MDH6234660.1 D-alanyl-D-alanine carboxypeptidase (penicillin-binding protein 5/6) [Mesorhizobium soli]